MKLLKMAWKPALIDRLTLTDARIEGMAEGLRQLVALEDPVGEITSRNSVLMVL